MRAIYHIIPVIAGFRVLIVTGSSFSSDLKSLFSPSYCFFATLVCFFNSLTNGKYSNLLIAAALSNKSFLDKTSLPVKNSYFLKFPDGKPEILAVYLSIVWSFVLLDFIIGCFDFLTNTHFYNKFFRNPNK